MARRVPVALASLTAILLAACATRVDGEVAGPVAAVARLDPDAGGATGPSDPGVTDTEIRIGASGPLSGLIGFAGQEAFGAIDSYFRMVNAQGGVGGRRLKLVTYDNRMDLPTELANVRKLYEEDKVVSIILLFADSVGDYLTRNGIPAPVFGVTASAFKSSWPTVYPIVGNALVWAHDVIAGVKDQSLFEPGMRVAILYDTDFLDTSRYASLMKDSWEREGAKVVSTDPFNFSDGDCTQLVVKMRALDIDWWDFQGLGWVLCATAAQRQGYRPNIGWGGWATSVSSLATQVGPWIDGMWGGSQGDKPSTGAPRFSEPQPAHEEYAKAIKTYHPDIATEAHLESPVTIGYWTGAKLLVAALKAQGKRITMAGINEWIANVENFETGIGPPILSMAPTCKTGSELLWIGRWKWDGAAHVATRTPATGFMSSTQKEQYGGMCFLTKLSDGFD